MNVRLSEDSQGRLFLCKTNDQTKPLLTMKKRETINGFLERTVGYVKRHGYTFETICGLSLDFPHHYDGWEWKTVDVDYRDGEWYVSGFRYSYGGEEQAWLIIIATSMIYYVKYGVRLCTFTNEQEAYDTLFAYFQNTRLRRLLDQ